MAKVYGDIENQEDFIEMDLTGDRKPEYLIGYYKKRDSLLTNIITTESHGFMVVSKDDSGLKVMHNKLFANAGIYESIKIKTTKLLNNGLSQALLENHVGNAGPSSIDVLVIGYDPASKSVKEYLNDIPTIIGGLITLEKDRLLTNSQGVVMAYKWNGSKFESSQVFTKIETQKDDVILSYSQTEEGVLKVSSNNIKVKVGQRFIMKREDKLNQEERIMQSGSDFNEMFVKQDGDIYKAVKPGTAEMKIVPNGGYDWPNTQTIKITVE